LVRQAFDAVLMRQQVLATQRRRVEGLQQIVDVTRRKHGAGEIAEFELLRAETELQAAVAEVAQARRGLTEAEEIFRRLLQLPAGQGPLRLDGTLRKRTFTMDLQAAVRAARSRRADLQSAELQVDAAKLQQRAVMGGFAPSL